MKKIRKYYVNPDDSELLAMSVVDEPAIESDFVYFSKQQKVDKFVAFESNEKHMIYGAAMRPDFPMYRFDGEEEYYIEFSKEAVEKLSRNFLINGFQANFTEQHKNEVDGITITESWIKADMEHDKSVAVGLDKDLPIGTWFLGAYCNNAEIWDKVKDGKYKGFSVECIVDVSELEFNVDEAPAATEPVNNEVIVEEQPAVNEVNDPEVPVKESILDKILRVLNPSIPKVEEEKVISEPEPEPIKEEEKKDESQVEPITEEEKKEELPNPLEEVVKNLKSEIESLKENNTRLLEKVRDLSGMPSVKPTNTNPNGNGENSGTYAQWREQVRKMIG